MGWDRPRKREKNFIPEFRSYSAGEENCEKNSKKIQKNKKLIPTLFLSKTGWGRPRKREKNFSPEFRSYSTRGRKFRKREQKSLKIKKPLSGIIFSQNKIR